MKLYRIAKWEEVFERAESRKLKMLTWVSMPVNFNSYGYQALLDEFQTEAAAMYGAWCALVAFAANCPVRGLLGTSRGIPLTISHLSRATGFDAQLFERLFAWAAREEIGWLIEVSHQNPGEYQNTKSPSPENPQKPWENEYPGESPDNPPEGPRQSPEPSGESPDYRTGQDKTRQDITRQDKTRPESSVGLSVGDGRPLVVLAEPDLLSVPCDQVEDLSRRIVRALPFTIPPKQLGRIARICLAAQIRSGLLEIANGLGSRTLRSPRRYWEASVRKMVNEAGYDFDAAYETLEQIASRPAVAASG